jgi:hypothetical protein
MIRPSIRTGAGLLASVALAIGVVACSSPGASNIPSISIPTTLPSIAIPSVAVSMDASGNVAACVDPATFAILNSAMASGADVPSILTTNKDALITSLNNFQPTDPAAVMWKSKLVTALQTGSMADAQAQVQALASGQVSVSSC